MLEKLSGLSIRVMERTGEKLEDIIHKSNPWEGEHCGRKGCNFCDSGDKKLLGKRKQRNIVYENECMLCKGGDTKLNSEATEEEEKEKSGDRVADENSDNKRKRSLIERERSCQPSNEAKLGYKYIGETSRSGYERCEEHWRDFSNLSNKSHILKHYVEKHMDNKKVAEVKFQMKIVQRYRSAFERQIGESVQINSNLRKGVNLLNSKNEYSRCSIPRLGISDRSSEELVERYEEEKEERELNERISKLVSKLRLNRGEKQPADKRRRLDKHDVVEVKSVNEAAEKIVSISEEMKKKSDENKKLLLKR